MVFKSWRGCSRRRPLAPPPAAGEPYPFGIVSGFSTGPLQLENPIRGWLSELDRSKFRLFGYYLGKPRGRRDGNRCWRCASASCIAISTWPVGATKSSPTSRMF